MQLRDLVKRQPLKVLSEADFHQWQTWGYVVIPNAISPQMIENTRQFLWEFQEMGAADPATWYQYQRRDHQMKELNNSGMVECYHHQTLWDNRQAPRVHQAFADIWDQEELWVTIDRANLNPPNKLNRGFAGFIHWDANTTLDPLPVNVQGVLALTDTDEETGGFQCMPELFRDFESWRLEQPSDRDPYRPDLGGMKPRFVPMQAGDLLIFNSLLAHGKTEPVRPGPYGPIHCHSTGRGKQYRHARLAHTLLAGSGAARGLRLPGRSSGMGENPVSTSRINAPRREITRA